MNKVSLDTGIYTSDTMPLTIGKEQIPENVFLGVPTHDGRLSIGTMYGSNTRISQNRTVLFKPFHFTNLECTYNILLCEALNMRKTYNLRYFAMLHSDIHPEEFWLDKLIDEADLYNADFMSAVVPLRDARGLTSTGMSDPDDPWQPACRLTLRQLRHPDFPETFDTEMCREALEKLPEELRLSLPEGSELLNNTGCMLLRIDRPWSEKIFFHKHDTIIFEDNMWQPMSWTEDWLLSQELHEAGAKVMSTRKVTLGHVGNTAPFWNNEEYGQAIDTDTWTTRKKRQRTQELDLIESAN